MITELMLFALITKGMKWLKNKRSNIYLDWKDYNKKIVFLDVFYFQQKVRLENIKNI